MRSVSHLVYNAPARAFHWLTAALLLIQFVLAWTMPDVHRDTQPVGLIAWHLGVGVVILLLVLVRIAWRNTHEGPPEPTSLPHALRVLARFTHWALYALLIIVPLMGWANASSRNWTVSLFATIPLPPLSPVGSSVGHALGDWHGNLAWVLLALTGVHICAALYHHFVLRDGTLHRMLPGAGKP